MSALLDAGLILLVIVGAPVGVAYASASWGEWLARRDARGGK